jgi:hypothetical protein
MEERAASPAALRQPASLAGTLAATQSNFGFLKEGVIE